MAQPYQPQSFYETTLGAAITATASTISVTVAPDITAGYLVIEASTSNREIIKYEGVSGTNLTGCVRGLAFYGSDDSAGTGKAHAAGTDIANKDVHYYFAQYYDFLVGTSATGANTMKIGDGAAVSSADRFWEVNTSSVSAFWGLSSSGQMVVSEDGITSYVISAGGSGVAGSNSVDITAGVVSVKSLSASDLYLSASGLRVSATKLAVNAGQGLATTSAAELYLNDTASIGMGFVPTGSIMIWSTSAAPTSWLLCDGTQYDGSAGNQYSALWDVLGTSYGGTSVSAFKVPNLKTRVVVGLSAGATAAYCSAMGYVDGVSSHTLTEAEMPAHTHGVLLPGGGGVTNVLFSNNSAGTYEQTTSTGSDDAHNNLQPYIVMTYIIKK